MKIRPYIPLLGLALLALSALATGSQTPTTTDPKFANQTLPTLSAQEIFKRVSPSVMVVESLDAEGSAITFGSGVVIAPGRVITNRHVIEGGASFRVGHGAEKWPAKLVGVAPDHDLAEFSVAGLAAPAVTVRDSSSLAVGERVYAIGAPEGLELTISEGLISGLRDFDKGRVIQTSAAISPGSSGGGLFDPEGRLVGITTFYLKEGQSLNFAVPAEWTLAVDRHPPIAAPTASESDPASQALMWFEAGAQAFDAAKYDVAAADFGQAVRLKPHDEGAWFGLGGAYYALGQYDKALTAEKEATRVGPENEWPWYGLGAAYERLGEYERAVNAYREAIRLGPENKWAWYGLGIAYHGLGKRSEVNEIYEKLKALDPELAQDFSRKTKKRATGPSKKRSREAGQ
jgi:tetratricopeptide (TPR) repeat protein